MSAVKITILLIAICSASCKDSGNKEAENKAFESKDQTPIANAASLRNAESLKETKNVNGSNRSPLILPAVLEDDKGRKGLTRQDANKQAEFSGQKNTKTGSSIFFPGPNRAAENSTLKESKEPRLLLPNFPLLFPEKETEEKNGDFALEKSEESKPFIFFEFSANLRRIPLGNASESGTDSNLVNVKKIDLKEFPGERNSKMNSMDSGVKGENGKSNRESLSLFDDFPFFPDGDLDEFFPKPDLLFPDILFHRKSPRKATSTKRDARKSSLKNDLKFFMDIFDEAFAKTKRDLERPHPFFDFFQRDGQQGKRTAEPFTGVSAARENPAVNPKWKNHRSVKIREERIPSIMDSAELKSKENPVVLMDKTVKISELNLPNGENHEKFRLKRKKKRESNETKKKHRRNRSDGENKSHDEPKIIHSKSDSDTAIRQALSPKEIENLRFHEVKEPENNNNETRQLAPENNNNYNNNTENGEKFDVINGTLVTDLIRKVVNSTESVLSLAGDIIKVIDSFEPESKDESKNEVENKRDESPGSSGAKSKDKKSFEELEKNITRILNQFMTFFKRLDATKLNLNDDNLFDWTSNGTFQNSNDVFAKRPKKSADFAIDYADQEKKVASKVNVTLLFLTVTVPSIVFSALVLLICFFSLRARGKICTALFKPRRVLIDEEVSPPTILCPPEAK